jgi:shikimate kinase
VKADKIYLVGFMAAGKTTLARALAARLDWRAEDIDELVESREHQPVTTIFSRHGEAYFRAVERRVLQDLLPARHVVVATGGGTFVDQENRAAINRNGASVWIDLPLEQIIDRLPPDGRRPLAQDRAQLERLYATRRAVYDQAHLRLDASRAPVDELVERLLEWLDY